MAAEQQTSLPTSRIPIKAAEDLPAFRFVSHLGSICGDGLMAAGVCDDTYKKDETASIITAETALIQIKAELAQGDQVASDANGYGVKATTGDWINGIAMFAGVTNQNIEIDLVRAKI